MRVVLSGGGTGGHVYPALSVLEEVSREEPDSSFLYIGTTTGLERGIVAKAHPDLRFEAVEITGFRRKLSFDNVRTVVRFMKAAGHSRMLLRDFRPDIVVGTGGYVCGPVVYAAARLGIPTLIHEQNAIPGLTNKFLSRYADTVAVSFRGSEKNFPSARHAVYTGNPRATTVAYANSFNGIRSLGLKKGDKLVLVVGGSRGAKAINEAMIGLASRLSRTPGVYYLFVTGEPYYEETLARVQELIGPLPERLKMRPYLHNMHEVLAATSLIVNRAGASFLAEITALGIPSILIPSPNVTNHHQEANARWLEKEEAAILLAEKELSGERLAREIEAIMGNPAKRRRMAENSRKIGESESASLFYREMVRLIR
ncbi:undecaprenyldiphospho-muramoylpentapeptide beta-N-acetylglucosaminyltransferase [Gorillibacterium timonense]|uniref:undecaprenyldiphospho-muramoylpentapeptide beta-N-acetylglucosaminyltransferase n=1 Tax=Gorillibacterium timonense TaxID=1689269 RepID=UPI00071DB9AA|nr:undecaprenyldiphospho-muramoylpentapeptide beta-N-acetylglucosaminyltransferase [Gorillibacterium timonense]